jgi:hypothetical protein
MLWRDGAVLASAPDRRKTGATKFDPAGKRPAEKSTR